MPTTETIAAIATPPGVGGIGIVRISGPGALEIGQLLTGSRLLSKRVQFRKFFDANGESLDHGLCLFYQSPHSYTGEDVVEIQGHGSPVLLDMLLERVCELGARLARAGEFSQRAFVNGKLDLAQAEAVADLIESGSRAAARAAMRSLEGQFSSQINQLLERLINLRSYVEAALDFAEEEVDFLADKAVRDQLENCLQAVQALLDSAREGRLLNDGLNITIVGRPNAGKSSLLNYLAGYEAAIVTEIAGTTRDVLRENISLNGIPVRINDTAGLRDTENLVEREGVKRARDAIVKADLVLLLIDVSMGITRADEDIIESLKAVNYRLIYSKSDLLPETRPRCAGADYISILTGEGMTDLVTGITGKVGDSGQDSQTILARHRHVDALARARNSIDQALTIFVETGSGELMAEDLRVAQQCLSEITGEFSSDDLLGRIFSRFCVGK